MLHSSSGFTERYPPHLVVPPLDAAALVAGALLAHGWRFGPFTLPDRY
jgi:putative colanic acid biosysnthesis UDP-glucose lipid carrier transferase